MNILGARHRQHQASSCYRFSFLRLRDVQRLRFYRGARRWVRRAV